MTATTMTLTVKRQTVFPLDWCRKAGLENGGPVNAFKLDDGTLVIRPVAPLNKEELARVLAACKPERPPKDWKRRVKRALDSARSEA